MGWFASPSAAFAVDGDSGGPVFKNGKLVGIINTVSEHCTEPTGQDYGFLNTATRLGAIRPFLQQALGPLVTPSTRLVRFNLDKQSP